MNIVIKQKSRSHLQQINLLLSQINTQYEQLFDSITFNHKFKTQLINKKTLSYVMQQIFVCISATNTNNSIVKNEEIFLKLFRSYIKNFIISHIVTALEKVANNEDFLTIFVEKWKNFKHFTYYYFAILHSAHSRYENAYFSCMNQAKKQKAYTLNSQESIFPVPVVAIHYFQNLVLNKYENKLKNIILTHLKEYRRNSTQKQQSIRILFEIIWSCGMSQSARIKIVPGQGIKFYREDQLDFYKKIKLSTDCEIFFQKTILNVIIQETSYYYFEKYSSKLRLLNPIQQIKAIKEIINRENQLCQQYMLADSQKVTYMREVYDKILLNDLEMRLRVEGGFKTLIQSFKYDSQEGVEEIKTYFYVLKDVIHFNSVIKYLQKIFDEVISGQGKEINKKINKKRQYIVEMLSLKKSMDRIIDEIGNKNFKLVTAKDKSFKTILDSIESSRNLADYADFTIKQCIKLKLDEQTCYEKFNDVYILLSNVASTDSFLLYHQQLLSKRIIDTLNEPKIQIQLLMLKKLSQKMGILSVSSHMSMIKDIQTSQQMTQKFNNRLPFSTFKWNLKILNPSYWPDYVNKEKLTITFPNSLYSQVKVIEELYHNENQYRYLSWKVQKGVSLFQGRFSNKKVRFQAENSFMMVLFIIAEQPDHKTLYGNLKQSANYSKTQSQSKHDPLSLLLYVLIQNRLIVRNNVEDKYSTFSESQQIQINLKYTTAQNTKPGQVIFIKPSQQLSKQLHQSSIEKDKIIKDRQKQIEAVLVKALKHSHATSNNSMTFSELYQAVREHHVLGPFNFSEGTVKARLQQLIARQFCIRDEDDRKIYHYVA